jgi:hypothetical protein
MLILLKEVSKRPTTFTTPLNWGYSPGAFFALFVESAAALAPGGGGNGLGAFQSSARRKRDLLYNFVKSSSPVMFFSCPLFIKLPRLLASESSEAAIQL